MRLAVPYDHGEVFAHFGRAARFKLYDITDNRVVSSAIVDTFGGGHGALEATALQLLARLRVPDDDESAVFELLADALPHGAGQPPFGVADAVALP